MGDERVTVTDGELIQRYRNGDQDAFDCLYQRYRKPLYSYLNNLLQSRRDAVDDVYQQTWIRVLDTLHRYKDQQKFLAWLFKIAHNLAMDCFRQNTLHDAMHAGSDPIAAHQFSPAADMENAELAQALALAVERLPIEQREVFILRQQDVAFKEIAKIQGTGINTALGRMRYAIRNLQEHLAEFHDAVDKA